MTAPLLEAQDPVLGRLVVPDGGSTALVGASGAGKSRWIARLLGLDRGGPPPQLHLHGERVDVAGLRRHVGWVPQTDAVFLSGTVWANVRRPPGDRPPPADADCREALDVLGLADRADDPCESLSRNQRRRVGLARALASRCELLVVDEPLDPTVVAWWQGVLDQAPGGRPRGVLTATAVADDLARSHDLAALVLDGRVVACDPWPVVAASTDPDVRGALAWVTVP